MFRRNFIDLESGAAEVVPCEGGAQPIIVIHATPHIELTSSVVVPSTPSVAPQAVAAVPPLFVAVLEKKDHTKTAGKVLGGGVALGGSAVFVKLSYDLAAQSNNDIATGLLTTIFGVCDISASGAKNVEAMTGIVDELYDFSKSVKSKSDALKRIIARLPSLVVGGVAATSLTSITYQAFASVNPGLAFAMALFTGITRACMSERGLIIWLGNVKWWHQALSDNDFKQREEILIMLRQFKIQIKRMQNADIQKILIDLSANSDRNEQLKQLLRFAHEYGVQYKPITLKDSEVIIKALSNALGAFGSAVFYSGASKAMETVFGAAGMINVLLSIASILPVAALQGTAMQNTVNALRQLKGMKDIEPRHVVYTLLALGSANPLIPIAQKGTLGALTYPSAIVASIGVTGMNKPVLEGYANRLFGSGRVVRADDVDSQTLINLITTMESHVSGLTGELLQNIHKHCATNLVFELAKVVEEAVVEHRSALAVRSTY